MFGWKVLACYGNATCPLLMCLQLLYLDIHFQFFFQLNSFNVLYLCCNKNDYTAEIPEELLMSTDIFAAINKKLQYQILHKI